MHHNVDRNEGRRLEKLLNSEGFRQELSAWMVADELAITDIVEVRLTHDRNTDSQVVVLGLADGRERAFPFARHRMH